MQTAGPREDGDDGNGRGDRGSGDGGTGADADVRAGLERAIAGAGRGGAASAAANLLGRDRDTVRLVGLLADGDRALYHLRMTRCLSAVPYDEQGVRPAEGEQVVGPAVRDPVAALGRHDVAFAWVHPRYRDRLDAAEGQSRGRTDDRADDAGRSIARDGTDGRDERA